MSTTDSPPPVDAGELLVNDHRQVESVLARLEGAAGAAAARADLIAKVVHDLSVHSGIEEIALYAAARYQLEDGDAVADQALAEGRVSSARRSSSGRGTLRPTCAAQSRATERRARPSPPLPFADDLPVENDEWTRLSLIEGTEGTMLSGPADGPLSAGPVNPGRRRD